MSAHSFTQAISFWLEVGTSVRTGAVIAAALLGGGVLEVLGGVGREAGCTHVDLRTETEMGGPVLTVEVEDHPLALAEHAEHRSHDGVRCEVVLAAIEVADHGADPGAGV